MKSIAWCSALLFLPAPKDHTWVSLLPSITPCSGMQQRGSKRPNTITHLGGFLLQKYFPSGFPPDIAVKGPSHTIPVTDFVQPLDEVGCEQSSQRSPSDHLSPYNAAGGTRGCGFQLGPGKYQEGKGALCPARGKETSALSASLPQQAFHLQQHSGELAGLGPAPGLQLTVETHISKEGRKRLKLEVTILCLMSFRGDVLRLGH